MSIQINGNASAVNWESLLQQIGELSKTSETGDKPVLTFTTTEADGTQRTVSINIPDDLDLPATVDQTAIDSLCAKLAADSDLGIAPEQIEQLREALTAALQSAGVSETIEGLSTSKSVMFDLYKLMALLVEVAQKQRDAAREMRSAESQQLQTSILNQAEQQRSAALTGMIASAICCAIQVGAMAFMTVKQATAFKTQMASMETTGVGSARQNLSMLKAGETAQGAQQQLASTRASVGEQTANRVTDSFNEATVAKSRVQAREIILREDTAKLQRLQDVNQPLAREDIPAGSSLERAQTRLDQFQEMQQLDAKPNRTVAETTRLLELRTQFNGVTEQQLNTELTQARTETAAEFRNTVEADRTALAEARATANTKLDSTLKTYEDAYDTAVRERAEVGPKATKEEIARLDSNLEQATADLKFARAHAINERIEITTADERQALTVQGESRLIEAQNRLKGDTTYLKAGNTIQRAESINGIINVVGNCVQSIIQNATAMQQAEVTKEGAVQEQQKEELEQMKDLFNQAGDLVQAVIQLMQAISSAETQSMRDAIQV